MQIEERAKALSEAGYPLPEDDPAMHAEQRLKEAKLAAHTNQVSQVPEYTKLSAREVCQVLREVVFGRLTITNAGQQSWDDIYAGHFVVNVEGWRLTIYNDCDELDYCEECESPDGRRWAFEPGDRDGTDPVALLSTWEHQSLEQMLKVL